MAQLPAQWEGTLLSPQLDTQRICLPAGCWSVAEGQYPQGDEVLYLSISDFSQAPSVLAFHQQGQRLELANRPEAWEPIDTLLRGSDTLFWRCLPKDGVCYLSGRLQPHFWLEGEWR